MKLDSGDVQREHNRNALEEEQDRAKEKEEEKWKSYAIKKEQKEENRKRQ